MLYNMGKCFCLALRTSYKPSTAYYLTQVSHRFGFFLKPETTEAQSIRPIHLSGCRLHHMELPEITSVRSEGSLEAAVHLDTNGWEKWLTKAPCLESLPSLVALTAKCRQAQWSIGFLEMRQGLRVSGSTFIVGLRYTFPRIHLTPKSLLGAQMHPRFSTHLVHCGKSSIELFSTLQLDDSSSPFFENLIKFVYLGKERKKALPDWFHKKYGCGLVGRPGTKFIELSPAHIKRELHTKNFTVLFAHIDIFGHANHSVYIKFIVDTIGDFLCHHENKSGLFHIPLLSVEIFYAGDCFEGDILKVTLLECRDGEKDFLGVQICKVKDNSAIVHFRAAFKDDSVASKSTFKL